MGSLSCLNVAGGDIAISFDTKDAAEALRAKRIIKDMLARGYALMVKVDGAYQRAVSFDEKHGEYIIADQDSAAAERADRAEHEAQALLTPPAVTMKESSDAENEKSPTQSPRKGRGGRRRLSMEKTHAVGVARSAGG